MFLKFILFYNGGKFKGGNENITSVYEEKNITKAIMRVGFPAMLGQLTTLIYNIADTFFVSLTEEPAMIAAVTKHQVCMPVMKV